MSGSSSLSSDALTDAERVDVRRFCGYPAFGSGATGLQSWRFFQAYGVLEFRLTNMAPAELQVIRQQLNNLYMLEQALPGASANLDTEQASVWKHNPSEVRDRTKLFDDCCRRLATFIGIPVGPALVANTFISI